MWVFTLGQLAGELVKMNLIWSSFPQTHAGPSGATGTLGNSFLSAVFERKREMSQTIEDCIYDILGVSYL